MRRSLSFFLLILLLLQSCYVYRSTSLPITRVVDSGRVKIVRPDSTASEVNNITQEGNKYFALYKGETIAINNPEEKEYYKLDANKTETRTTIAIVLAIVIPIALILTVVITDINQNGIGITM